MIARMMSALVAGVWGVASSIAAAQMTEPPAPADLATAPAIAEAPPVLSSLLQLDRSDRMTLPVSIAGQGPFGFIVDTGAERTVVSRELAGRLGLRSAGQARVVGLIDSVMADMFHIESIALHDLELQGTTVPTFAQADIGGPGLIGIDSLEQHKVVIDFLARRFDIRQSEPTRTVRREPEFDRDTITVVARRRAGRMILSNATINGHRVDIVIDTGAQSSIGNIALQRLVRRQFGLRPGGPIRTELRSVTGAVRMADLDSIRRITISGIDINDLPVVYADSPAFDVLDLTNRPALLLGMDALRLFDRIAIDFTNRRVTFDLPAGVGRLPGGNFARNAPTVPQSSSLGN